MSENRTGTMRGYLVLVSRQTERYHAVWVRDYLAAADPNARSVAVCGQPDCEPYDAREPMVRACELCFPMLREIEKSENIECVGAPRRNFSESPADFAESPTGQDFAIWKMRKS